MFKEGHILTYSRYLVHYDTLLLTPLPRLYIGNDNVYWQYNQVYATQYIITLTTSLTTLSQAVIQ